MIFRSSAWCAARSRKMASATAASMSADKCVGFGLGFGVITMRNHASMVRTFTRWISLAQQDPTDQRRPSRHHHNVDPLPAAPCPMRPVPREVVDRIGFVRILLDCRHGCTPQSTTLGSH
jgi:hypothetical protein